MGMIGNISADTGFRRRSISHQLLDQYVKDISGIIVFPSFTLDKSEYHEIDPIVAADAMGKLRKGGE